MLLDNHHAPDPRVEFELDLLSDAGVGARVIAWDRRGSEPELSGTPSYESPSDLVRIHVPAPSGGGRRTCLAMLKFARRVWHERHSLFDGARLLVVHDVYLLPLGRFLAGRLHLPFIYDAHEEYARMEAARYPRWFLRAVTAVESRLARSAAAVVVPGTSRTARWSEVRGIDPIVLPNIGRGTIGSQKPQERRWDIVYVGTLSSERRIDLLLELAEIRPDSSIAVAGRGKGAETIAQRAAALPNVDYLGWRDDPGSIYGAAGTIYYGLDPRHPYSSAACPNTLYQALQYRRPIVFFCGGEPAELADEFAIGIRCEASAAALAEALDTIAATPDSAWEFVDAWRAVSERVETDRFVATALVHAQEAHRNRRLAAPQE